MKFLVDEVEVAIPYGTRSFMVIRSPARAPLRFSAPGAICADGVRLVCLCADGVRLTLVR